MRSLRFHALMAAMAGITAALLVCTPVTAAPEPGAAGIGDEYFPTYGNGGYDVGHYDLRLTYRPGADLLSGTTTLLARAHADLSRFNLDFALTPRSIYVNGRAASFRKDGTEIVVTPARPILADTAMTVSVSYAGHPASTLVNGVSAWVRTPSGGAVVLGQPLAAWWWFPSNDHPLDKATFDITMSVPSGQEAISNGTLQRRYEEFGFTRWQWRVRQPMATYLAFVAIGQYDIVQDTTANGRPVLTAYEAGIGEHENAARASIERTVDVVDFLSGLFGPYPFDALGAVVPSGSLRFAMENQTRPVYSPLFFRGGSNLYVVVHEMAHQWFGNSVTLAAWRDTWSHEGFASYAEWLWSEANGEATAAEVADWYYGAIPPTDAFWQVTVGEPGAANIAAGPVYIRGAMALQALRTTVGDDTFFAILRRWVADHAYGNAANKDFIALAEAVSERELDGVFDTWLYSTGRPAARPSAGFGAAAAGSATPIPYAAAQPASISKLQLTQQLLAGR
jgi:aminopeptidase N